MHMLRANYHTHTKFCDGDNTPEEMVKQALDLGFEHLGFSGHMDPDIHMDWDAYTKEIKRLQKKYADKLDILMGVELDNMYNDPASCSGAEYIIGSTHFMDVKTPTPMSVDSTTEHIETLCNEFYGGDYLRMCRAYYELEAKIYDKTHCTFIGHFDLITRFNDQMHFVDETSKQYLDPAKEAMEYLVGEGVPFEINCGAYNRNRKKYLYPRPELLKVLQDFGGGIFINTDAHQKEKLNAGFDYAIQSALEAGFTHLNILAHNPVTDEVETKQLALDTL